MKAEIRYVGALGIVAGAAICVAACTSAPDGGSGPDGGGSGAPGDGGDLVDGPSTPITSSDAAADAIEGGASFDAGACTAFSAPASFTLPEDRVCSIHGACLRSPSYFATETNEVWGTSTDDVWVSGPAMVVHMTNQGKKLSGVTGLPFVTAPIAGSSPNDVWLGVLHWDGVTLTPDAAHAPPGRAWFAASNDAWAVHGKNMAHWNGATWTDVATPAVAALQDVFGFASNDVYAVGGIGLFHWDGATWSAFATPLPAAGTANRVWGTATDDFWVAGDKTRHFTGGAFVSYDVAATSIYGWAGGMQYVAPGNRVGRFTGTALLDYPWAQPECGRCGGCRSVWTATNGDFFVTHGIYNPAATATRCGIAVAVASLPTDTNDTGVARVAMSAFVPRADGTALGIAYNRLVDSRRGQQVGLWGATNADDALFISGTAEDDLWVAGNSPGAGIALASHWDGAAWTYKALPDLPTSQVHPKSPASAWVLTGKHAAYFDGATWTDKGAVTSGNVVAIWGDGPSSAIAVGDDVYRWNGATWTRLNSGFADFVAVGGTGATKVTAVRDRGNVVRWDGVALHPVTTTGGPEQLKCGGSGTTKPCRLRSFAFRGDEIWGVGDVMPKPYFEPQPHLWRLTGSCWTGPDDGVKLPALPLLGVLGERVRAAGGEYWLDAPPMP